MIKKLKQFSRWIERFMESDTRELQLQWEEELRQREIDNANRN